MTVSEVGYSADEFSADIAATGTVYERMVAILGALPAIGKGQYNEQQRFHYRGHDDMLNALNPLLARYGVFAVPQVLDRVTAHRQTSGGKTMYEVSLHVQYTFYGASGDSVVASAWGEGTDMGDKSTSKAMTAAFKQVLQQSFAISTEETKDPDGQTPEETTANAGLAAPRGWPALILRWEWLFGGPGSEYAAATARAWMLEIVQVALPGTVTIAALPDADKRTAGKLLTDAVLAIEALDTSLEFGVGVREKVIGALVPVLDGVVVEGPMWRMDPTEEDLPVFGAQTPTADNTLLDATTATETPTDGAQDEPAADGAGVGTGPQDASADGPGVDDIPF